MITIIIISLHVHMGNMGYNLSTMACMYRMYMFYDSLTRVDLHDLHGTRVPDAAQCASLCAAVVCSLQGRSVITNIRGTQLLTVVYIFKTCLCVDVWVHVRCKMHHTCMYLLSILQPVASLRPLSIPCLVWYTYGIICKLYHPRDAY